MLDILLVDEADLRGVLEKQLTEAGHRVQTAVEGRTGAYREHPTRRFRRQPGRAFRCIRFPGNVRELSHAIEHDVILLVGEHTL